ncbi:MAG: hypothetical protein A2V83_03965 [Nitrospirae bacterium RBG_16_64_22]|nr:MAG: hypothetical protein A2V83_03965 [Nitrospirae bacterium RBG_16_64_22]
MNPGEESASHTHDPPSPPLTKGGQGGFFRRHPFAAVVGISILFHVFFVVPVFLYLSARSFLDIPDEEPIVVSMAPPEAPPSAPPRRAPAPAKLPAPPAAPAETPAPEAPPVGKKEISEAAAVPPPEPITPPIATGRPPVPETLTYNMEFFLFNPAAVGTIRIAQIGNGGNGRWQIEIEAKTVGFLSKLGLKRNDRYRTVAHMTPYGLVPDLYEMEIRSGKKYRSKRFSFDYEKGRVWMEQTDKDGAPPEQKWEYPLSPTTPYFDPLTTFYNFRLGWLGEPRAGETYRAAGIPLDQGEPIRIRLVSAWDGGQEIPDAWDATVFIENRTFIARKSRTLFVRFDRSSMLPTEGRAQAVSLLGDVVGTLKDRNGAAWKTAPQPSQP